MKRFKPIDIIAVNIRQGGGLVLLNLLIKSLSAQGIQVNIHLDSRLAHSMEAGGESVVFVYYKGFLSKLLLFGQPFDRAFYFGNIPPFTRKARDSSLYFHHPYIAESYISLLKAQHWKFIFLKTYVSLNIKNVDTVYVQTKTMQTRLLNAFGILSELMPFYDDKVSMNLEDNKIFDFAYISLPNPNKNFSLFLDSLLVLSRKIDYKVSVVLTVPKQYAKLIAKIDRLSGSNIVITNYGKISKSEVMRLLKLTNILVFPSLDETFGLPLVEACQSKMRVICSDKPFAHEVIVPSATFDPKSIEDIVKTMEMALSSDLRHGQIIIENNLEKLINRLTNE